MTRPIKDVMKACEICINWGYTRKPHADCPYFPEEACENELQKDVMYYLERADLLEIRTKAEKETV